MVSKASELLPEPERPVITTSLSRGMVTSMFLRLCSRAPRTTMALRPEPVEGFWGKASLSRAWQESVDQVLYAAKRVKNKGAKEYCNVSAAVRPAWPSWDCAPKRNSLKMRDYGGHPPRNR